MFNDELQLQKHFDKDLCNILSDFLHRLSKPICLIAHNGNNFDFPLLQYELSRNDHSFDADILCADSLEALRAIDDDYIPAKASTGYDRFHNINEASETLSTSNLGKRRNVVKVLFDERSSKDLPPVGPSILKNNELVHATPSTQAYPKRLSPPALVRKGKNCGCNPPHGNTELEHCFSKKRRLHMPVETEEEISDVEPPAPSNFDSVKRKLKFGESPLKISDFDEDLGAKPFDGSSSKKLNYNNITSNQSSTSKNKMNDSLLDDSLSDIKPLEDRVNDRTADSGVMDMLRCDESFDSCQSSSLDIDSLFNESNVTDNDLVSACEDAEITSTAVPSVVSSATKIVLKNQPSLGFIDNNLQLSSSDPLTPQHLRSQSDRLQNITPGFDKGPLCASTPSSSKLINLGEAGNLLNSSINSSSASPSINKKSFALGKVYYRLVGVELEDAHNAESDCIGLIRIFQKSEDKLLQWIDKNAKPFKNISHFPLPKLAQNEPLCN